VDGLYGYCSDRQIQTELKALGLKPVDYMLAQVKQEKYSHIRAVGGTKRSLLVALVLSIVNSGEVKLNELWELLDSYSLRHAFNELVSAAYKPTASRGDDSGWKDNSSWDDWGAWKGWKDYTYTPKETGWSRSRSAPRGWQSSSHSAKPTRSASASPGREGKDRASAGEEESCWREWLQSFQNPPAKKLRKEETNSEHGADLFKKAVVDRESSGRNHDDRSELGSAAGKRAPSGAPPEVSSKPLEGRSQDLERPFMRFSEAPRPEEVRPLPVLREAFKKTREKWTKDQDWSYVGEMLRSIRQDLTIQMLRDIFVVEVHEYWAQLALEVGDFKQFDQAAVQLQAYYADPTLEKGATKLNEVLAWRLLYLTVEGEGIATTEFLRRNAQRLDFSVPVVKLAWRLRRAISQRCHTKAMHMLAPPKTEGQTGEDDVPPVLPESLRAELLRRVKLAQLMEVCKAVRENMSRSRLENLGLLEDESDPTIQMPIVYQKDDLVDTKATYEEAKKQLEPTLLRENGVGQVRIFRRLGRQRADHLNSFMRNPGKVVVKEEPQEPKPGEAQVRRPRMVD